MAGEGIRGSELLREKWQGEGRFVTEKDLDQLLEVEQSDDAIKLLHWWIYGQPHPEVVRGVFQVHPKVAGRVIDRLFELDGRYRLDVFPYGIPAVDGVLVGFETTQGLRGR